jgi:hypothetical protein
MGKKEKLNPQNLYRNKWKIELTETELQKSVRGIRLSSKTVSVLHRFSGGMVYEVKGQKYLLAERIYGRYPFLLVLALTPGKQPFRQPIFDDIPDEISRQLRSACETVAKNIELPGNLHNVEVDVTGHLSKALKLPAGWTLWKGNMKVSDALSHIPGVSCDCDVDGPCGYCCDICDCNSCYNCC